MTWATEMAVGELEIWEKVIMSNASLIARLIINSQLGPIVLTPNIVEEPPNSDEFTYGVIVEQLQNSPHSN